MVDKRSRKLLSHLHALGEVTQAEALDLVNEIYADGVVSKGEAEGLFDLNRRLDGGDPDWHRRFIEAISDFMLGPMAQPKGWVTNDGAAWLTGQIAKRGQTPSDIEIDLLVTLCRRAEGMPLALSRSALLAVSGVIQRMGFANAWNVERMRQLLHAPAGEEGLWVSRFEANTLFETNDAIAFAHNDSAWNDLFARAIANHLLAAAHPAPDTAADALRREKWLADTRPSAQRLLGQIVSSIGEGDWFARITSDPSKAVEARNALIEAAAREGAEITPDESSWLLKRLGWAKEGEEQVSPAERALIAFLNREVPGFTVGLAAAA